MIKISYETNEIKELTCDSCGTKIRFEPIETAIRVYFIPAEA